MVTSSGIVAPALRAGLPRAHGLGASVGTRLSSIQRSAKGAGPRAAILLAGVGVFFAFGPSACGQDFPWSDDDADGTTAGHQYTYGADVGGGSYVITTPGDTSVPPSTSPKYTGADCVQYEYKLSRGQGVSIELDVFHSTQGTTVDISQYTYLCFWVLGTAVGQLMRVGVQSGVDNDTQASARVVLDPYVVDGGTGEGVSDTVWRSVNVPTASLMSGGSSYDPMNVDRVTFMLLRTEIPKNQQGTLWIDNVYFSDTLLPVRIAGLAGRWCSGGIELTWEDLREALHTGFRVYRQSGSSGRSVRLDDSLITEDNGTYTVVDRAIDPQQSHRYTISAVMPSGTEEICDTLRVPPRAN